MAEGIGRGGGGSSGEGKVIYHENY